MLNSWKVVAQHLSNANLTQILEWAIRKFGEKLTLACSFGAEDVVLVDALQRIPGGKKVDIFYLDTDLHFPETYETRDRLEERYGIRFKRVTPDLTLDEQQASYGPALWRQDPNRCCYLRKVQPLEKTLSEYDAWMTGIRREQSPTRRKAQIVEVDQRFLLTKVNPLVHWTSEDVWAYIRERDVPYNPLHDERYPSIGCAPCTRPVHEGEDLRSGRWSGFQKTECGLHQT
ncbi:phosphoadenosine phosphosulfate reductase [Novibacillus thermophilus]|uniref:Adenosine 5'-phosphosulfate reductase n=1 Tax=Novibacillus thermophilus TaxID=1471761 RepID=A0A1U9K5V8_9BACL|nr:phosphoadenosine phosphosulfate reductase [Novibacillus thermophilus]